MTPPPPPSPFGGKAYRLKKFLSSNKPDVVGGRGLALAGKHIDITPGLKHRA